MHNFEYRVFNQEKDYINLEQLRKDVFKIKDSEYYMTKILEGKILVIGCFYQDELVAGAYLSNSYHSLFVEQIFVRDDYQGSVLHVGYYLMKYILEHKEIFDEFFHTSFDQCRLESRNCDSFYEKLGFKTEDNILGTMRKRI